MKLVLAMVQDDDSLDLIENLNEKGFRVTKLATTGGFLKAGNTTLIIGVEKEKVQEVINIIEEVCKVRKQMIATPTPMSNNTDMYMTFPIEVEIGGATVFVIDVDQFVKI